MKIPTSPLPPAAETVLAPSPSRWCKALAGDTVLQTYTADASIFDVDAELERMLLIHERQLLEAATDPTKVLIGMGPDCLIGWDTEYYTDPITGK